MPLTAVIILVAALAAPAHPAMEPLAWTEILETGASGRVVLGARLWKLDGQRVRISGFMAHLEVAPRGAFYLASRPVESDESGGGTADLPPDAIRVVVPSMPGDEVAFVPGPIEVTGVLHVGREEDAQGRVSRIRIVLEGPAPAAAPPRS
jgi:hypothetical protein